MPRHQLGSDISSPDACPLPRKQLSRTPLPIVCVIVGSAGRCPRRWFSGDMCVERGQMPSTRLALFTIIIYNCDASVMWLRPEINVFIFFREVARGCSQSQRRNRHGRGRPAVASLFTVIFTSFGYLLKAIYCLLSYFYLITSISYVMKLEKRMKSTSVNKNMTKLWRH